MISDEDKNFAIMLERMIEETCASIDSAYLSEDFLASANESFDKIPIFRSLRAEAENNGDPTDAS